MTAAIAQMPGTDTRSHRTNRPAGNANKRPAPAPFSAREFLDTFGDKLKMDFARDRLQDADRDIVCLYAHSLVLGDGSAPAGISPEVKSTVEFRFALTVVGYPVKATGMPGQKADWAEAAFTRARQIKSVLRTGPKSRRRPVRTA